MEITKKELIQMGCYNKKPIDWIILDYTDDKILLLCENIINRQRYHCSNLSITWKESSIRNWLNTTFLTNCFTNIIQKNLCINTSINENNPYNGTTGGAISKDYFFLLSISEVNNYLPRYFNRSIGPQWWLRTPGDFSNKAMYIGSDGQLQYFGYYVYEEMGVRPAVWVQKSFLYQSK